MVIQSNTIVRFQSGGLALGPGQRYRGNRPRTERFARDFKITPASGNWTEFYISRASGVVQIIARKKERHHSELRRKYFHHQRRTTGLA